MASSVSGDQSLSLSLSSGRTITRLSSESLEERSAVAMPSITMADSGERIALEDGDAVETSGDASSSAIIVDAVMKSLASSLAIDRRGAYRLPLLLEDHVRAG